MPYVTDVWTTYTLLAALLVAHILLNYAAVRGVVLRSLNRQRAGLLWSAYRHNPSKTFHFTPSSVARHERIFSEPSELYNPTLGLSKREVTGYCHVGTPLSSILIESHQHPAWWNYRDHHSACWTQDLTSTHILSLLNMFADENFIVWLSREIPSHSMPDIHIILKEGHAPSDHLKAWALATELAVELRNHGVKPVSARHFDDILGDLQIAKKAVDSLYPAFRQAIEKEGWDLNAAAGGFVTGLPTTVYVEKGVGEDKKTK